MVRFILDRPVAAVLWLVAITYGTALAAVLLPSGASRRAPGGR